MSRVLVCWRKRSRAHLSFLLALGTGACQGVTGSSGDPSREDGGGGPADGRAGVAPDGDVPFLPVGAVVISEIMYHPVYEQSDQENHEFVEIYNRDPKPVDLARWTLTGGKTVKFVFPDGAVLMGGQYAVVAKNKAMLSAAYGLGTANLYGDYEGELSNSKDTLTLADAGGKTVDLVPYNSRFPWPLAADAFGVGNDWLPANQLPLDKHQYKGRSLERISLDGPPGSSTWPANWESSPVDGATPGRANAQAGTALPIVEECSTCPNADGLMLASGQPATLRARFSTFAPVSDVQIEYFFDDLVKTAIAPKSLAMIKDADGAYSATLPERLKDNDLIRYRIKAQRSATAGVVGPRPSDPLSWFTAFVSPKVFVKPGVETKERVYHLMIRPSDWSLLEKQIAPGKATGPTTCIPNPDWNATVPATFVFRGNAYDVRVRYEGSRFNRKNGFTVKNWPYLRPNPSGVVDPATLVTTLTMNAPLRVLSWDISFPRYQPFEGVTKSIVLNKMHQGCPGAVSIVEGAMMEKAGLPTYRYPLARLHIDGGYYGYMGQPENIDEITIARAYPNEPVGDLFKDQGLGAGEHDGPISRGDFWPLDNPTELCPGYTATEYYAATYERKTHQYRPYDDLIKVIKDLYAARKAGTAAVRTYFNANWDVPALAATLAVRNWAGAWDTLYHNLYPYRRPDGKWVAIQQDYELDFGLRSIQLPHVRSPWDPAESLYKGWADLSMQTCELPGVSTAAEAQARGCTSCHGATPLVMPLMLPTQVMTPADAALLGCYWGGLPAIPDAATAAAACSGCHVPNDPKTALKVPSIAYSGDQGVKLGCRYTRANSIIDAFTGAFKSEIDKAYCRLVKDGTLSADGVLKLIDDAAATFSLDDWMAGPAEQEFCADPMNPQRDKVWDCKIPAAHDAMRAWARARHQTVMQRLKCQ